MEKHTTRFYSTTIPEQSSNGFIKMGINKSILDEIGNTPLLDIEGNYVKCEFLNPSGSIKDRIAKYFIEKAEQKGLLNKDDTIVEASTGNTGTALAMVGAA